LERGEKVDNKSIVLVIIIVLVVIGGLYLFATQNNGNTTLNTTNNSTINTTNNTNQETSNGTNQNNAIQQNNITNVKVSATQAQKIAVDATKDLTGENDTAGTPTLIKWTTNNKHTWVWVVPLTNKATGKTSKMDIDAITGDVILNE
jgi:uncharacterized protein YxeA